MVDALITRRKLAEHSAHESEEWFHALFTHSPDSMLLLDPNTPDGVWRIVDCNDAACRINGYTREDFVDQPIDIYLPEPADPKVLAEHLDRLRRVEIDRREVLHRRKDGTIIPLEASISLISLRGRELVLGIDRDITERKSSELLAQAEQAARARDELLAIVSHEMRTPITLLKGNIQLLRERLRQYEDARLLRSIETVERQTNRMSRLIDDLSDLSRVETGRMQLEMLAFDLGGAVRETVDEQSLARPDFTFRLDGHAENLWVWGDRGRIQQVISNLLTNAVKYSRDRKEVDVRVAREGAQAVVTVTDYGIGIPEGQQDAVFALYVRGTNVASSHSSGLGIGLYISKSIVDRHGGTIGVRSEEPEGSTFRVSLPIFGEGYD